MYLSKLPMELQRCIGWVRIRLREAQGTSYLESSSPRFPDDRWGAWYARTLLIWRIGGGKADPVLRPKNLGR